MMLNLFFAGYSFSLVIYVLSLFLPRKKLMYNIFRGVIGASVLIHLVFILSRYFSEYFPFIIYRQFLPVNTFQERFSAFAFVLACVFAARRGHLGRKSVEIIVLLGIWAASLTAMKSGFVKPLIAPPYQTYWLSFYSMSAAAGFAFLFVGFAGNAVCLINKLLKKLKLKFSLGESHDLSERFIYFGFPLLSLSVVLRACWANLAWGRWWLWTAEEMATLLAWLLFMFYFYLREKFKDAKKSAAFTAAAGFVLGFTVFFLPRLFGFSIFNNF